MQKKIAICSKAAAHSCKAPPSGTLSPVLTLVPEVRRRLLGLSLDIASTRVMNIAIFPAISRNYSLCTENTKMNARSTEMRKQSGILRKQYAFLLAESTEMRKQSGILRKQYAFLLAKSTEMRKQSGILRKQYAFLLIEID